MYERPGSFSAEKTEAAHREIAKNACRAAAKAGKTLTVSSRGDSTLRGHYPLETETLRKTPVKDHNRAHYPYEAELQIGGMTCENCARKIENALNELDGVRARVNYPERRATLRSSRPGMEAQARAKIREAGYITAKYTEKSADFQNF